MNQRIKMLQFVHPNLWGGGVVEIIELLNMKGT